MVLFSLFHQLLYKIDNTVGVAHLVVIPGKNLDELVTHLHRELGGKNRRVVVANDVAADDRVFGVFQDAFIEPSEAAFIAALISSTLASFSSSTTKSTTDRSERGASPFR